MSLFLAWGEAPTPVLVLLFVIVMIRVMCEQVQPVIHGVGWSTAHMAVQGSAEKGLPTPSSSPLPAAVTVALLGAGMVGSALVAKLEMSRLIQHSSILWAWVCWWDCCGLRR